MRCLSSFVSLAAFVALGEAQSVARILPRQPTYSVNVPKDLIGFSIETTSWIGWAGNSSGDPNRFTLSALKNLQALTGEPVPLRVGGGTQDNVYIDPSVDTYSQDLNATDETRSIAVSDDFYALSNNFAKGTEFTWGLNYGALNTTQMREQARALANVFQSKYKKTTRVKLERVELGNEVDFITVDIFYSNGPDNFNVLNYTSFFEAYLDVIAKELKLGGSDGVHLQIGDFAGADPAGFSLPGVAPLYTYWPAGIAGSGILESKYGKFITTYAVHHYETSARVNPSSGNIFRREAIRGNASAALTGAFTARKAGLEVILGETNSIAQSGTAGISNTAEGALYTIDYALQNAVSGVPRIYFHNGNGSAYNFIQPTPVGNESLTTVATRVPTTEPHLGAPYYGAIVVNEFLSSEKNTYVAEMSVSNATISGYALYHKKQIKRILLLNYSPHFPTDATRSVENVNLSGLKGRKGTIKRFYTPYLNSTTGLNWGGISFDTPSAEPTGKLVVERYSGGGSLNMNASSVAMILLD